MVGCCGGGRGARAWPCWGRGGSMLTGWPMEGALPSTDKPSTMMTLQARACKRCCAALQCSCRRQGSRLTCQHSTGSHRARCRRQLLSRVQPSAAQSTAGWDHSHSMDPLMTGSLHLVALEAAGSTDVQRRQTTAPPHLLQCHCRESLRTLQLYSQQGTPAPATSQQNRLHFAFNF